MNALESQMLALLLELKQNHHVIGVKAEFEDEGARISEIIRLKELAAQSDLYLTLKIGGCGALRDMYDAKKLGATQVVAPMIESAYARHKFIETALKVFPQKDYPQQRFFINIETHLAAKSIEDILNVPKNSILKGLVLGRVDLTGSMGLDRTSINSDEVLEIALKLFSIAKSKGLECAIGGGISLQAIPFLKKIPHDKLNFFETRKIVFKFPEALPCVDVGIKKAMEFELLWLKNKKIHYSTIASEDDARLSMLESRYQAVALETK